MADTALFVDLRPVLFGIAYRMLGSAADAEDVLQEAWIRWDRVDRSSVDSPACVPEDDRDAASRSTICGSPRSRRETYQGPWLPDPSWSVTIRTRQSVRTETWRRWRERTRRERTRRERAGRQPVYCLPCAFRRARTRRARRRSCSGRCSATGTAEIAESLDRSEVSCRQLVSRARHRIGDRRRRFEADKEMTSELTSSFLSACGTRRYGGLMSSPRRRRRGMDRRWRAGQVGPEAGCRTLARCALLDPCGEELLPGTNVIEAATLNGQPGFLF